MAGMQGSSSLPVLYYNLVVKKPAVGLTVDTAPIKRCGSFDQRTWRFKPFPDCNGWESCINWFVAEKHLAVFLLALWRKYTQILSRSHGIGRQVKSGDDSLPGCSLYEHLPCRYQFLSVLYS